MFHKFISWLREVMGRMFGLNEVSKTANVDTMVSSKMQTAIDTWWKMFENRPDWVQDDKVPTLGLPAAIVTEMARLVTVELDSSLSGSARADYLNETWQEMLSNLRRQVEFAGVGGHLVFKPYVDRSGITVDYVKAGRFVPTAYNASKGEITGGVFLERIHRGKVWYTRLERHEMTAEGYIITNEVYASGDENLLGGRVELTEVPEWAELAPELVIKYKTAGGESLLEHPLFAVFNIPMANTIDPDSPLGPSIFSRAAGLIEQADRQYGRTLWEYEGSELAVHASVGALRADDTAKPWERDDVDAIVTGRPKLTMPHGRERLFQELSLDGAGGKDLYEVFSPAIRDGALFNGLDKLLKRIEFSCSLSYGTLSDPQSVDKTAEEIKMSKQRSYSAVSDIQRSLQVALERVAWIMDIYASVYSLAPVGTVTPSFTWGDAVTVDTDKEREQMRQDCRDGAAQWWEYRMRFYGETEEEAKAAVGALGDLSDDELMGFGKPKKGVAAE